MQKSPEFLAINPNGRIPALIDDSVQGKDGKGNNVFESAAVMMWSLERYDKENRFWFEDQVERSKTFSWMFFVHGGTSGFPLVFGLN
jgi:glutathione S-transferase